jgi:hypothetical protein
MRAREFTINIPVHIVIHGDSDPDISTSNDDADNTLATKFAPPLQQKLELMKHAAGKQGAIIDQIVADDDNDAS